MSQEDINTYNACVAVVAALAEEDRLKIQECQKKIEAVLAEYGQIGLAALALVGSKYAAGMYEEVGK